MHSVDLSNHRVVALKNHVLPSNANNFLIHSSDLSNYLVAVLRKYFDDSNSLPTHFGKLSIPKRFFEQQLNLLNHYVDLPRNCRRDNERLCSV